MCSEVIFRLKERNSRLMFELKKLNENVSLKMSKIRKDNKRIPLPEKVEATLESQLDSLNGLIRVNSREIEGLRAKLERDAGAERAVELDKALKERARVQKDLAKQVREKTNAIHDLQKRTERVQKGRDLELEVPCCVTLFAEAGSTAEAR
jgi:predicted RNase H-like nuclease (RuvC/YqgF family)